MGKLVVIEGIDGSGKSTQLRLVKERLRRNETEFMTVSFPRYEEQSSALIKMYLGGQFGTKPGDVNAYAAASFFAVDRFASYRCEKWGRFYDNGGLVLTDRYTTSNAVHQGAKLSESEQEAYFNWLYNFEFDRIGLPKPDLVLYLDISAAAARERISRREGITDIHEEDAVYLSECVHCARYASQTLGWTPVDASGSEESVHEKIFALIKKEL